MDEKDLGLSWLQGLLHRGDKERAVSKTRPLLAERYRIRLLLQRHRLIPIDQEIAEKFSLLLARYSRQGLRKADALVAATASSRRLPLLTRNTRHYRFISEITLIDPLKK